MIRTKFVSCGTYLPEKILTNNDLSKIVDTSDEWIVTRTGIKKRHIAADNELTSDLATKALTSALNKASLNSNDLDAIILATTTPDIVFPATAIKIQQNIGMNKGFAFDIQAVCSGFVYAVSLANSMIKTGQTKRVAVVGAEIMSRILDWKDRSTCVLFGDGAGAMIFEASTSDSDPKTGILATSLKSDPNLHDILKVDGGVSKGNMHAKISMNGREVFKHAVKNMISSTSNLLNSIGLKISDLDCIIPHQANHRIIKAMIEKMNISDKKVISTVAEHANTSAASIPLAFEYALEQNIIQQDNLIALTSAGAGMTWGSILMKI